MPKPAPAPEPDSANADATPGDQVVPIKSEPPKHFLSIYPGPDVAIPSTLAALLRRLEESVQRPLWLLVQHGDGPYSMLDDRVYESFLEARHELARSKDGVALLIDSPGGYAEAAYQLARLLRRAAKGFVPIVPRRAKSAATLLTLGGRGLLMGDYAELGPLDAQLLDMDHAEGPCYVIDDVQAPERLHAFVLSALNSTMILMKMQSGKRIDSLLPAATHFVSEVVAPLFGKIDVARYSEMARVLKVAEDYALRLLAEEYDHSDAKSIAQRLVHEYSEHGFVIDVEEVDEIGLHRIEATDEQKEIMDQLLPYLKRHTLVGRLRQEKKKEAH